MEGGKRAGKGSTDNAPVIVGHLQSAIVPDATPVNLSCRIIGKFPQGVIHK